MDTLRIRRLKTRYHLAPSQAEERPRLDRILRAVLDEALEGALERAGVLPWEEICIRRLHVPVPLRLSLADSALALTWSRALSDSIVRARNGEYLPNVVRYTSISHALFDAALGVSTGQFARAWAWRLARVWRGSENPSAGEAAHELVASLLREPGLIAPLLAGLSGRNVPSSVMAALWRKLDAAQWVELASAALEAAGVSAALMEDAADPGVAELVPRARRMLEASGLARAMAAAPLALLEYIETRRAFAVLIVLECDPAALRPPAGARALVSALTDSLHPSALRPAPEPPARARERVPEPEIDPDDNLPPDVTRHALTAFGGLPFLLKTVEALGLPEEMLERFPARPLRWTMHQLALVLTPAEAEDPAALAFAGLMPTVRPPSSDEPPPTPVEREVLTEFMERLEAAIEPVLEERHAIAFMTERNAEVIADPGWIEIHLALRDVSTAIRRAGLDLDPGYLPWLGVVVRFVYA